MLFAEISQIIHKPLLTPAPLEEHQVHIWLAHQPTVKHQAASLRQWLSSSDLERAERYLFQKDRDRFILSQGILQVLCSSYLGISPLIVSFTKNPYGKPGLLDSNLYFNLSHSGEWIIYGFGRKPFIGIDIEQERPIENLHSLVGYYFSPAEVRAFTRESADRQLTAFYRGWTRKEAYIKAVGMGLSLSLHDFDVSLDETPRLLSTQHEADCHFYDLQVADGYTACLAVNTSVTDLQVFRYLP